MSDQITTAFVQQYSSTVMMLAQQKKSRLRNTVTLKTDVVGKTTYMDYVGVSTGQKILSRHGDTPLNATPHTRRKIDIEGYDTADLIDDLDKVKTLADFNNPYANAQAAFIGRQMDDVVITAAFGTAYSGETGATAVTFPAAQQVAVNSWKYGTGTGNSGMTISKLIEASTILKAAEVDPTEELYGILSAKQVADLLATMEYSSGDFNTVRPLTNGEVVKFMGFNLIQSERLPTDASGYRRALFYAKSGIGLALARDLKVDIGERKDKRLSTQVYTSVFMGASRLEETKVVEVKCVEA